MNLKIIYNHKSGKNLVVDDVWFEKYDDDNGYSWSEDFTRVERITLGELTSLFRKYKKKFPKLHTAVIVPGMHEGTLELELETNG